MRTYSDERPESLLPLGDGNYHYNYNIEQIEVTDSAMNDGEEDQTRTAWVCDTAFVQGTPTVAKIVGAVVKENYTSEEVAMMSALHTAAAMGIGEEPEGYSDYLSLVVETRSGAITAIAGLSTDSE